MRQRGDQSPEELFADEPELLVPADELEPESPHAPHALSILSVEDRPGHDRRYAVDPSKIRDELGWRPREAFEDALRATVARELARPADDGVPS